MMMMLMARQMTHQKLDASAYAFVFRNERAVKTVLSFFLHARHSNLLYYITFKNIRNFVHVLLFQLPHRTEIVNPLFICTIYFGISLSRRRDWNSSRSYILSLFLFSVVVSNCQLVGVYRQVKESQRQNKI